MFILIIKEKKEKYIEAKYISSNKNKKQNPDYKIPSDRHCFPKKNPR